MEQGPNNNAKKKVVIKNPYAKKKRALTPPAPKPAPKPPPPPAAAATTQYVATTFSQAFGNHHDDELDPTISVPTASAAAPNNNQTTRNNQQLQQQQPTIAADDPAYAHLTDRESHVLLTDQQPHVLYVSHKQTGNSVLNFIRNVPWKHARMVPDFILSATRCALFLSCKYHALYPQYILRRMSELGHDFTLRVLLVLVDVQDSAPTLRQLNRLCVTNDFTLILAWSEEEAARYLETFKAFDGKDATLIQKRDSTHFADQVADFLTACKAVNKTDSAALMGQFGSIQQLAVRAGVQDLALVSGMGQVKVKRLYDALHKPFSSARAAKRRKEQEEEESATAAS